MSQTGFFGRKVVAATFVMAVLGWGIGFYGPPVFLYSVMQRTGWSQTLCSAAVTVHFLAGTLVVVKLPDLYARFGLPRTTVAGSVLLATGVYGWSVADQPYELFVAALLSGFGWVTMGAAAVNATIAPWFVTKRPSALAMAYNGASIGGVLFSSGWVWMIHRYGFEQSAIALGVISVAIIATLSVKVFSVQPEQLGQHPDGALGALAPTAQAGTQPAIPLRGNRQFLTLALAMSLGLFAQIGLISQLFVLLVDHVTEATVGLAMGLATASAIVGRVFSGKLLSSVAESPAPFRRAAACVSYGCQALGCLTLMGISMSPLLLWPGMILFGLGIGNATSLPPLIAQAEFARGQVARVVSLIVATAQGCYAFAPFVFGTLGTLMAGPHCMVWVLALAGSFQGLAIMALRAGRERANSGSITTSPT